MMIDNDLLLILKSSGLGDGEPDLGEKLMKAFLSSLFDSGTLPARIICLNSGIFLTTEGSPVKDILDGFTDRGVEILSCGTCLDYYDRTDKLIIGQPTNMKETVAAMLSYTRILSP
ncbi:sulfurtransferase-like selenium metabolism protein YedF [Candidatus Zixiibacteriota bacterium]